LNVVVQTWDIDVVSELNRAAGTPASPHSLEVGDLLLLGSIADGEIVRVTTVDSASALTISRGHSLPTVMAGRPTWTLLGNTGSNSPDYTNGVSDQNTQFIVTGPEPASSGLVAGALLLMGAVNTYANTAGQVVITEVVSVSSAPVAWGTKDGLTQYRVVVVREQGFKPDGSAGTTRTAADKNTVLTLLTKVHTVPTTVVTQIGKDGEPLVIVKSAAIAVARTAAEGELVDFAFVPQGGRTAEGTFFEGGSGISTYRLDPCDPFRPPFMYDRPIQIVQGQEYLKSPGQGFGGSFTADTRSTGNAFWMGADGVTPSSQTSAVSASASGGTMLELKGWYLAPMDMSIEGGGNTARVTGPTVERNENYLLVTVGARPSECADPTQTTPCADGKYRNREVALLCELDETPAGYCENNWLRVCRCTHNEVCDLDCGSAVKCLAGPAYGLTTNWYPTSKTSIRCSLPATINANQDLNIYWHGIKTTLHNWYRPHAPVVSRLVPSSVVYSGGELVTIIGNNFGPKVFWTAVNEAGTETQIDRQATVSLIGKGMAKMCDSVVWVSPHQLICKVPALANHRQDMNTAERTVTVSVVVDAGGLRSRSDSSGSLTYTMVPTYFTCNSNEMSEAGKNTCFSCCRSSCIVDEFASGTVQGGATYSNCETACYKFCGF
jgi:hypothetical protein